MQSAIEVQGFLDGFDAHRVAALDPGTPDSRALEEDDRAVAGELLLFRRAYGREEELAGSSGQYAAPSTVPRSQSMGASSRESARRARASRLLRGNSK
jgi:hypothetical protein